MKTNNLRDNLINKNEIGDINIRQNKSGNIFVGLVDNIMKETGSVIVDLLNNSLKFNSKKMELKEIDDILVQVTKTCTFKLYHEECEQYSLRRSFEQASVSPFVHSIALNNVTYAVMTAVSPIVLGSMFYYFSKEFIFYHIRDVIVEPNYRDYILEAKNAYETPSDQDRKIYTLNQLKKSVTSIVETLLLDTYSKNRVDLDNDLSTVKRLSSSVEPEQIDLVLKNEIPYPIPSFIMDIIKNTVTENTNTNITKFIELLTTTFTLVGLRNLYKQYGGIKTVGQDFETKLSKLFNDRQLSSGIEIPVDGLDINQYNVFKKLLSFTSISKEDTDIINNSKILERVKRMVDTYPSIGTNVVYDNEKITITNNGKSKLLFYKSDEVDKDSNSPFIIFGDSCKQVETIYNTEPDKFCGNQAIMSKKDKSSFIVDSRKEPTTILEKKAYNDRRFKRIMNRNNIKNDSKLMSRVTSLRNGNFESVTYISPNWFSNISLDDNKHALLVLAEMQGLRTKLNKLNYTTD